MVNSLFISSSDKSNSFLDEFNPFRFSSILQSAFWNDSWKFDPIDITSPTDFIWVVNLGLACGNFSNANLGIFVTI